MRKHPTKSEALLFGQLRKRKLGVRFRWQHAFPLGYIVDFYGAKDMEHAGADAKRQAELEAVYGVRFVRVSAELVERDVRAALR